MAKDSDIVNSIVRDAYPIFQLYQRLRNQLMEILSDPDLAYKPGEKSLTLGELCLEIGEIQVSYIRSFRTFSQDFNYRHPDPSISDKVSTLAQWFRELDEELKTVIDSLSETEIENRKIDRGGGFEVSPRIQLEIYKEALLIFYGKASIYLRLLGKAFPEQWSEWIG